MKTFMTPVGEVTEPIWKQLCRVHEKFQEVRKQKEAKKTAQDALRDAEQGLEVRQREFEEAQRELDEMIRHEDKFVEQPAKPSGDMRPLQVGKGKQNGQK